MTASQLKAQLKNGFFDERIVYIYGEAALENQKARYAKAVDEYIALYGDNEGAGLFTVAGRSELSGNHTDHNHGAVIAASIDLDIIAVAAPCPETVVSIKSEGFPEDKVNFAEYSEPKKERFDKSDSLIAGVCRGFTDNGYKIGGFTAYTTSNVLKGSGISSSAAFEDMVGNVLNFLYNDGKIDNVEIAKISQFAENAFFGKPCGLMDQMACAVGGIIAIDFKDPKAPVIEKMDFDLSKAGYNLCITNTGGNHADLTGDYASVPTEMKAIAKEFGKEVLRDVDENKVLDGIASLRLKYSDRAIMRALHFYEENRRVKAQTEALKKGDLDTFLACALASGRSSFCYLQNVFTTKNVEEQGVSLALCLSERVLSGKKAAWRVHGGGFAGTIQAYVPADLVPEYKKTLDRALGEGKCMVLRVRPVGATKL